MGGSNHLSFDPTGALRISTVADPKDAYHVNALGSVPILSLVYWEVSAWRKVTFGVEINRWLEHRLRSRAPQGMGRKWGRQRRTKWGCLDSQAQHTFFVFSKCLRYIYLRKTDMHTCKFNT